MKLATLRIMRQAAHPDVRQCIIMSSPLGGWILSVGPNGAGDCLESKRGGTRIFKSIDAAFSVANDLGYPSVELINAEQLAREGRK